MGLLGPRRVDLGADGASLAPPYRLVNNTASLLDLTDLVFIDPVTTGYSRAEPADEAKQFHGVTQDLRSVAEFIRLYVTKFRRWDSPKYLAGESYGTTRAAGLADQLQNRLGMNLNGIILVSSVLNFQTVRFDDGNDLPYVLFLPTYTATAWYHKKLAPELQADRKKTLEEVEQFALGDYTLALMKGGALPAAERQEIARKLARYTGLSEEYVRHANLRIEIHRFTKELLRGSHKTVGRYDSRYVGRDGDAAGEHSSYDPSYAAVQGPYTALLQQYLAKDLQYVRETPYRDFNESRAAVGLRTGEESLFECDAVAAPGDDAKSHSACLRGQRLLRPGDAVPRHALHHQSSRSRRRFAQPRAHELLRRRAHDVHREEIAAQVA